MCSLDNIEIPEMPPNTLTEEPSDNGGSVSSDEFDRILAADPVLEGVCRNVLSSDSQVELAALDDFPIFKPFLDIDLDAEDMPPLSPITFDIQPPDKDEEHAEDKELYRRAFIDSDDSNIKDNPELFIMVNPRTALPVGFNKEKEDVPDDVRKNNGIDSEEECASTSDPVFHMDHCYSIVPQWEVERRKALMAESEVKVEAAPAKRPVGRPRKASTQQKRSVAHFDQEEIVDVESIQVKKARRTPQAKSAPAARVPAKRRGRKPNNVEKSSHGQAPSSYTKDSNGSVMRPAKTSAMKKIAKTKKSPAVSRSKRNDHNDMERRRRHEMKTLFDQLKVKVPGQLLVDSNGKIKKNPSKNTILNGARRHLLAIQDLLKRRSSLVHVRVDIVHKMIKFHKAKKGARWY